MISKRVKDTLGQRIKYQRKRLDMTQEELAEIMHIPKSTISAYENDKVDIKGSVIVELSKCLFTNPNYLLGFAVEAQGNDPIIESFSSLYKGLKDEKMKELLFLQMQAVEKVVGKQF